MATNENFLGFGSDRKWERKGNRPMGIMESHIKHDWSGSNPYSEILLSQRQ
jgi:hypothetical protein